MYQSSISFIQEGAVQAPRRIVAPIDYSEPSRHSLDVALRMAKQFEVPVAAAAAEAILKGEVDAAIKTLPQVTGTGGDVQVSRELASLGRAERARSLSFVPQSSLLSAPMPVFEVVAHGRVEDPDHGVGEEPAAPGGVGAERHGCRFQIVMNLPSMTTGLPSGS